MVRKESLDKKMDQLIPALLYIKNYRSARTYRRSDSISAEARLAARRAARAEARDIRMRELEKQQKQSDEQSDRHYDMFRDPVQSNRQQPVTRSGSQTGSSSLRGSRKSSEESDLDPRDMRHQLSDLEEKFRKAMINNAQMDNEKSSLQYQVDVLRDEFEELEEKFSDLQREHKLKCKDHDKLKRDVARITKESEFLKVQIELRDKMIAEHGLVLVTENGEDEEIQPRNAEKPSVPKVALVSQEAAHLLEQAGEGSLDVRLKRFAEEKQELLDEIRRLKIDLEEELQKNCKFEKLTSQGPHLNGPDMKFLEIQRETNKQISDYKFRLQKSEQEVTTLQGSVARLESQITRYKSAAEASEKVEDELKADKRKFQRELREMQARIEELETANNHLQKRIDKLKSVRNTLVK